MLTCKVSMREALRLQLFSKNMDNAGSWSSKGARMRRLTWFVLSSFPFLACSSKSSVDQSTLTLAASSETALANGTAAITISITAVASDGQTPYAGQVKLTSQ